MKGAAVRCVHEKPVPKFEPHADAMAASVPSPSPESTVAADVNGSAPVAHGAAAFLGSSLLPSLPHAFDGGVSALSTQPRNAMLVVPPATIPEVSLETETTASATVSSSNDTESRLPLDSQTDSNSTTAAAPTASQAEVPPTPPTSVYSVDSRASSGNRAEYNATGPNPPDSAGGNSPSLRAVDSSSNETDTSSFMQLVGSEITPGTDTGTYTSKINFNPDSHCAQNQTAVGDSSVAVALPHLPGEPTSRCQ